MRGGTYSMVRNFSRRRTEARKAVITSRFSLDILRQTCYNLNGTERNGTERNGTERNGTERNGTERNGSYTLLLTFLFVFLFIALPACSAGNSDSNNSSQSSFTFTNSNLCVFPRACFKTPALTINTLKKRLKTAVIGIVSFQTCPSGEKRKQGRRS
jgi:hypothetical protein